MYSDPKQQSRMKTCYKNKDSEAIGHEDTSYLKGSSLSQRKQERLLGTEEEKGKRQEINHLL